LKDQLAEAGYSEGRSKDVIKNGIYRVNSQGQIEQEDDEIIEIVRRTLSGILSRDITFQDMKEAIVDNHEKIHGIIKDGDIERFRTELVHLLGTEKYDDLLLYYQHMYGEYDNSQKLLEELVVNYFMEKALESEIRLLPDKKSIERMTLRSFDEGIGYLIENMFWEKLNEIGYYGSLSEKIGKRFGKYIARKAFIFSRKKENNVILIGLESSWIDKDQMPYIQELFNQLTRIYKEKGLGNIIIKRENGENLAKTLSNEIEDRKVPLSNVIILGSKSVLKADAFNDLRRPDSSGSSAFFAGIELPQDFPKNSHIRILDMIRLSMALALDKAAVSDNPFIEVRANKDGSYTFIPRAEPLDYGLLKTMYKAQLVAMMAA